jgi:hypothetical protein
MRHGKNIFGTLAILPWGPGYRLKKMSYGFNSLGVC